MNVLKVLVCAGLLLVGVDARRLNAQTVSSTTGAINGTVTDSSKGVIPGVTVTLSGPALMGVPTTVTEPDGTYRFSTVPIGEYKLNFELSGFGTVTREGIRVSVGFTATVNAEMNPGSVAETITVSGASPVVDVSSTSVASHYDSEKLAELPGSRDPWAVIAQAPAVAMQRMDVGGSGAWAQQVFRAYGLSGGQRNEIEGIVANEGSGSMYYTDFGSFEEISVTPVGNTSEVGTPGVYSNFVSKSGGNVYHGNVYLDFENESMETTNIDDKQIALGISGNPGQTIDTQDLNRLAMFRDFTADIGGFVKKDKLWWYFSFRNNVTDLRLPTLVDEIQHTYGPSYTGKGTANLSENGNHKLVGYFQRAGKIQPSYLAAIILPSARTSPAIMRANTVWSSGFPNTTYKAEYNGVLSSSLLLVVRGGANNSFWFRNGKSADPRIEDTGNNFVSGGMYGIDNIRRRPQASGSLSYFKQGWAGTHNFKVGGEVMRDTLEQPFRGFINPTNSVSVRSNGAPIQVRLYQGPNTSVNKLLTESVYISDSWLPTKKLTINLGVRLDRYRPYLPAQTGPAGQSYAAVDKIVQWNNIGPRVGGSYDLTGKGKTVIKANYGKYWLYPSSDFALNANPNPAGWYQDLAWTDLNSNGVWNPGEEGRVIAALGGAAATTFDSAIKDTYQHQLLTYLEREIAPNLGVRTGFVWNGQRQVYGQVNVNRPLSAFTVPVTVQDPGPDGVLSTKDDGGTLTAYNLSAGALALPVVNITQNLPERNNNYYTWEVSANRRQTGSWSLSASFAETWNHDAALGVGTSYTPNNTISSVGTEDVYKTWQAKITSTLRFPLGLRVIPLMRHQSGVVFARTFTARLNWGNPTVKAERIGDERTDNVTLFDVRTERVFTLIHGVRVTGMFDLYNLTNSNVEQDTSFASGSTYRRPVAITPPRIARVGFKVNW
jgi:hypothetical protein